MRVDSQETAPEWYRKINGKIFTKVAGNVEWVWNVEC